MSAPALPNVPAIPELAQSDEGRDVLRAAASTGDVGRSILTTPGVPSDRLQALRSAFQAMLNDPDFLAACEKRNLMVDGATGEEIDQIANDGINRLKVRDNGGVDGYFFGTNCWSIALQVVVQVWQVNEAQRRMILLLDPFCRASDPRGNRVRRSLRSL